MPALTHLQPSKKTSANNFTHHLDTSELSFIEANQSKGTAGFGAEAMEFNRKSAGAISEILKEYEQIRGSQNSSNGLGVVRKGTEDLINDLYKSIELRDQN